MRFFHDGSTHQTKKKKHVSNFILLRLRCCVMWKIFTCVSVSSDWTIDFSSPNKRQKKWKKEKKIYWKWPYVWICSILSTYISNSSQGPIDHQTSSINWESPWAKIHMFDVLQFLKLLNKSNIKFKEARSSSKLLTTLGFDKQLCMGFGLYLFSH